MAKFTVINPNSDIVVEADYAEVSKEGVLKFTVDPNKSGYQTLVSAFGPDRWWSFKKTED